MQGVNSFAKYGLISLCNVIYKIFTNVIATRLAVLLPKLISVKQGAFVRGWSIVENIALAQELFRDIGRKVRGGNLVVKLHMEKAYDRVDWQFLKQGFEIGRLSPSLFILAAETFSKGLSRLVSNGRCQVFKLKQGRMNTSHLLYVDDTVLFLNGPRQSITAMTSFISKYQDVSGQRVNLRKSSFFCSRKLTTARIRSIKQSLGISKSARNFSYLGVPLVNRRIKCSLFAPLVNKVAAKIQGWNARILSQAGRLALISYVLNGIPIHKLPATIVSIKVLENLESIFADFFWGWHDGVKKLH
ncbi:uncharacterized protein LOC131234544 [Magnolia sinica]|uniref:uncharacterized protein LOC131234544 n=1 Tax=Magnolia sinica TaxID=86752 RepID=UPI00265A328B|nr:uncharacterized protein LOC131234544 [Magnolia sinica]